MAGERNCLLFSLSIERVNALAMILHDLHIFFDIFHVTYSWAWIIQFVDSQRKGNLDINLPEQEIVQELQ